MTVEIYGVGKVTASKSVLNELARMYILAIDYEKVKGDNHGLREIYEKRMLNIHEALDKTGYYDCAKGHGAL